MSFAAPPATSSSSTSTSNTSSDWLSTAPKVPDGKIIRPSRFIDAAKKGQDDLLQEFRNDPTKNIDVNKHDSLYKTSLHWAASAGHLTTVKLLVSWGANVNFRDMTGETPLHKAAFGNHVAVINVLIKAGADRDVRNKDGLIAMDLTEERSTRFALAPPEIVDEPDQPFEQDDEDSD
mmetsp:Transcript_10232/g.17193  ORF Transcript_10232/g.17193 Transcript_10232/m.17193 type:complete len:177 (+) Transcript_10232:28-558(+)